MSPLWQKGHEGTPQPSRKHRVPDFTVAYLQVDQRCQQNDLLYFTKPFYKTFVLCSAALIRGNRTNCTQFSRKLDWLVSKLERLESSSGIMGTIFFSDPLVKIWKNQKLLH